MYDDYDDDKDVYDDYADGDIKFINYNNMNFVNITIDFFTFSKYIERYYANIYIIYPELYLYYKYDIRVNIYIKI